MEAEEKSQSKGFRIVFSLCSEEQMLTDPWSKTIRYAFQKLVSGPEAEPIGTQNS